MKKSTLQKTCILGAAAISCFGILLCTLYILKDTSLDRLHRLPRRVEARSRSGAIQIGVIGDSWVSGQQLDQAITQTMLASGIHAKTVSVGHSGAKIRQIYRDLFRKKKDIHSSNALLMDEDLDFLIVVAGVNDSAGHIGKKFYAHHMVLIMQTALARGIQPVVVEVPEYGIEDTPSVGFLSWWKRKIYLWLFDQGQVDVIEKYRKALREQLHASGLKDKVLLVDFSPITDDYSTSKALYANPSHLNHAGSLQLGTLIAQRIQQWYNSTIPASSHTDGLPLRR